MYQDALYFWWTIITHYVTILIHFLSYFIRFARRGECRQLEFWARKGENIRDIFCTTPKVLKFPGSQFWNILEILGEESTRGAPPTSHEGAGRAPCLVGHLAGPQRPSSAI